MEIENIRKNSKKLGTEIGKIISLKKRGSSDDDSDKSDEEEIKKKEIDKRLETIRKEIQELKEKEYKRLQKEFMNNNYGIKYNVSFEIVLSALFGFDFVKREITKFQRKTPRTIATDPNFLFKARKSAGIIA